MDVAIDELAAGRVVRLGELGSLRVSISSEGVAEEKDVVSGIIKSTKVIFTPGNSIKQMQNNLTFQKM